MLSAHKQLGRYTVAYSVFGDLLRFSKQSSVSSRLSSCIGTQFKYIGEPFYSSLCNLLLWFHPRTGYVLSTSYSSLYEARWWRIGRRRKKERTRKDFASGMCSWTLLLNFTNPSAPQFWGLVFTHAHTIWRRTTKFDVVTPVGRGMCLGVSHAYHRRRAEIQGSPILGFSCFYAYTL